MDAKTMDAGAFEILLDRLGTDFAAWPADKAEQARKLLIRSEEARRAHTALSRVEAMIASTRPLVTDAQAKRVVNRALAAIVRREAAPTLMERFRLLLAAPLPRAAFAMSLTALGFAVGIAVGYPNAEHPFDREGSAFVTTSADDVLF